MSTPCPDTRPHRSHFADNADGICGGVPKPDDLTRAGVMVLEALNAAEVSCTHRRRKRRPCRFCVVDALLDLSVFEPVLFPLEDL